METPQHKMEVNIPRVAITYCTQCRWMLRAAYFGQELLSTFGTSIGEIALIPATGGIFSVHLTYKPDQVSEDRTLTDETREVLIWDRKTEGGFPETKILKQKIRNFIEPSKSLGHSDTPSSKTKSTIVASEDPVQNIEVPGTQVTEQADSSDIRVANKEPCEDCT